MSLTESIVEDAALIMPAPTLTYPLPRGEAWELGYAVGHGPQMAPGEPAAERDAFGEVVPFRCAQTLIPAFSQREKEKREALRQLNSGIPEEARATV